MRATLPALLFVLPFAANAWGLIAAIQTPAEDVQVLRDSATALGRIGPRAADALPALEGLAAIPRVPWAAEEAIERIR